MPWTELGARAALLLLTTPSLLVTLVAPDDYAAGSHLLSRKKRYVVFPEGSSFSIALCMTVHTLTPDNIFTEGLNWGISYDLPNESKPEVYPLLRDRVGEVERQKYYADEGYGYMGKQRKPEKYRHGYEELAWNTGEKYYLMSARKKYRKADYHYAQRRHRRDLYSKIEVIVNAMGFDGRSCILRALCEASQRFMPRGSSLMEEMMRIVFVFPQKRLLAEEPEEHRTYTDAHKAGREGRDCRAAFPGCGFSLVDMALGKYTAAPEEEDEPPDDGDGLEAEVDVNEEDALPAERRYTMK